MNTLKIIGRFLICAVLFAAVWFLLFFFCGILGSFFYDGINEQAGEIYGFAILTLPIIGATISTGFLYRKLNKKAKPVATPVATTPSVPLETSVTMPTESRADCCISANVPVTIPFTTDTKPVIQKVKVSVKKSSSSPTPPKEDPFVKYGGIEAELLSIDLMEGHEFENWCAHTLRNLGYTDVEVTPASGDHGVDVLAKRDGIKYAIQCKRYKSDLGNTPVQEVHAGKTIYHCQVGVVLTNRHFTSGAKTLAEATGTLLWDRDWIRSYLEHKGLSDCTSSHQAQIQSPSVDISDPDILDAAVRVILDTHQASVSMIERRLHLGYVNAVQILDALEAQRIVGPFNPHSPREILIDEHYWKKHQKRCLQELSARLEQ